MSSDKDFHKLPHKLPPALEPKPTSKSDKTSFNAERKCVLAKENLPLTSNEDITKVRLQ